MENIVIDFISKYIALTDEEISIIEEYTHFKSFPKDTVLLAEGVEAKECFFVMKGIVRSYYLVDGEERNTDFYTENQTITPASYITKQPSEYYLSALEDSVISVGIPERNAELIQKVPKLQEMIIKMSSELLIGNQTSLDQFRYLSPEERYIKFLETRPDLLARIPQYHLASYLGVTPVSLSRMRKRISKKNLPQL